MESVWQATAKLPTFGALEGDIKTDVLVVGGGMAGLLCAYKLRQAGVECVLAEAATICGGITQNTTAKVTVQHGLVFDKLVRSLGEGNAKLYLQANLAALEEFRRLCSGIDCNFSPVDSFVYSLTDRGKLTRELAALNRLGVSALLQDTVPLPLQVAGAVRLPNQAQFHPLRFAAAIAQGLPIYEHTKVLELTDKGARTRHGTIAANKIIVATHFPFVNKHGSYFLKMYQHRSYVLALQNAPDVGGIYVDEAQKGMSFRNHNGLLLLGGGDHRTGKQGGNWRELEAFAKRHYPNASEKYRWATQDCMTLDGLPYIGQYSARTPNFYVACGFNKWGMTSSMVAATLLTDMVTAKHNPCTTVFSPSRSMLHPQLAVNAWEATLNLLTPTTRRCPHMGCALKWNADEHSWDCPCHGSRFTTEGKLLDNPATGDIGHRPK